MDPFLVQGPGRDGRRLGGGRPPAPARRGWVSGTPALALVRPYRSSEFKTKTPPAGAGGVFERVNDLGATTAAES